MREEYDRELTKIKEGIMLMSAVTEKMLADSVYALQNHDALMARGVIDRDDLVDEKEIELQLEVSRVIATQAPVATDLRRLASTYKIITNLERIADLSVNISKRVIELANETYMKQLVDIPRECELAEKLLKLTIRAFIDEDISGMKEVIDLEDEIDDLNRSVQRDCLQYMMEDKRNIFQGSIFIFIGSYLERIGDHATNIFETVYYITTGDYIDLNDLNEKNSV